MGTHGTRKILASTRYGLIYETDLGDPLEIDSEVRGCESGLTSLTGPTIVMIMRPLDVLEMGRLAFGEIWQGLVKTLNHPLNRISSRQLPCLGIRA